MLHTPLAASVHRLAINSHSERSSPLTQDFPSHRAMALLRDCKAFCKSGLLHGDVGSCLVQRDRFKGGSVQGAHGVGF